MNRRGFSKWLAALVSLPFFAKAKAASQRTSADLAQRKLDIKCSRKLDVKCSRKYTSDDSDCKIWVYMVLWGPWRIRLSYLYSFDSDKPQPIVRVHANHSGGKGISFGYPAGRGWCVPIPFRFLYQCEKIIETSFAISKEEKQLQERVLKMIEKDKK